MPSLKLVSASGPVLQDLAIDWPHLGTPLGTNLLTLAVGVATEKVLAEMVKDWQALGPPILQVFLKEVPDRLVGSSEQADSSWH